MDDLQKRSWAEIFTDNIRHNYKAIRAQLPEGCRFLGIVKADAYGHGALRVSQILEEEGADYLAVSCLDEALELHHIGSFATLSDIVNCHFIWKSMDEHMSDILWQILIWCIQGEVIGLGQGFQYCMGEAILLRGGLPAWALHCALIKGQAGVWNHQSLVEFHVIA